MASKKQNKNTITILLIIAVLFFLTKGNIPFLGSAEPLPCGGNTNLTCPSGYSCTPSINASDLSGTCEPTGIMDCVTSGGSWIVPTTNENTSLIVESYCSCPTDSQLTNSSCEKIPPSVLCTNSGGVWEATATNVTPSCTNPQPEEPTELEIIYYRFENNACSQQLLAPSSATANDYSSLAECENKITTTTPPTGGGSETPPLPPPAQSGKSTTIFIIIAAALTVFILWRKKFRNATKR